MLTAQASTADGTCSCECAGHSQALEEGASTSLGTGDDSVVAALTPVSARETHESINTDVLKGI